MAIGDHDLHLRLQQRTDPRGRARLLRDGARRPVLPVGGRAERREGPAWGLVLQGVWAAFLVLPRTYDPATRAYGNLYSDLLDYVISAALIFYILTIAGVFRLRSTRPDAERPYRAFGYPIVPALYIVGAATILLVLFVYRTRDDVAGAGHRAARRAGVFRVEPTITVERRTHCRAARSSAFLITADGRLGDVDSGRAAATATHVTSLGVGAAATSVRRSACRDNRRARSGSATRPSGSSADAIEHVDDRSDVDGEAGLFAHLARDGGLERLAAFDRAAGQAPFALERLVRAPARAARVRRPRQRRRRRRSAARELRIVRSSSRAQSHTFTTTRFFRWPSNSA